MDREAARTRVQIWLAERYNWAGKVPQILDDRTVENEFSWIFYFRLPDRPIPRTFEDLPMNLRRSDWNWDEDKALFFRKFS